MSSIELNLNGNGNISIFGQGSEINILPDSVAMSPKNDNLIYLFDPLYYNGYVKSLEYPKATFQTLNFLQKIFNKYSSIIPRSEYVFSRGEISNKNDDPSNLKRKGKLNGSFFSYEKSSDDSDIPVGRGNLYRGPKSENPTNEKERKKALLKLIDPKTNGFFPPEEALVPSSISTFNLLEQNQSKTFSCFIRLNAPVKHKSTNSGKVIRGKKAIFLDTKQFTIGYRSPHYLHTTRQVRNNIVLPLYKYKFEPFSFVFSIKDKAKTHTFMTDFKYKFGETYHLVITIECGVVDSLNYYQAPLTVKVYINGEQQNTAYLEFNPLIRGNKGANGYKSRSKADRLISSPVQPYFHMKNGNTYSNSNSQTIMCKPLGKRNNTVARYGPNILFLGKSNLRKRKANFHDKNGQSRYSSYFSKRYLNDIDIGVIQIYNIALSQNQVNRIYNNFGIRYQ